MNLTEPTSTTSNPWVSCPKPNSEARLRLFFFPYAGAGSTTYHAWNQFFPPEVEIYLVHLPGRDQRISEAPFTQFAPLVESTSQGLVRYLDKPFCFFGHSMGGLIAFEVARQLRRQHSLLPVHLFISGRHAPHLSDPRPPLHGLPESEFLTAIQDRYGALPEVVLTDRALLEFFLSILRADVALLERYQYNLEKPLECPISAIGGLQDRAVAKEELLAWRDLTENRFELKMFPGDHFFVQSARTTIAQFVNNELEQHIRVLQ